MKTVGARLRAARNRLGISQQRLGDILGVSKAAISRWESDIDQPQVATLPAIRKALNISLDELVCGDRFRGARASLAGVADEQAEYMAGAPHDDAVIDVALQAILLAITENVSASAETFVEAAELIAQRTRGADGEPVSLEDPRLAQLLYIARKVAKMRESGAQRELLFGVATPSK